MIFDFWVEYKKASQNKKVYFEDMWNIVDLFSNTMNLLVVMELIFKFLLNVELVEIEKLRIVASICCFFMWMKSLYWLRLFHQTAYFVKLITETF